MKTLRIWIFPLVAFVVLSAAAYAAPTIDTIRVQGYIKKANGTAVSDGSYTLAYGVFQNGTMIWGKSISTTLSSGLFSAALSGAGSDLSALGAGTGMNADYSGATLNPALLMGGGSGSISVRVYAVSTIDGNNPQFDIAIASVPSAFVCDTAYNVATGSVALAGISSAARTVASAGAGDASKLIVTDASGLIDLTAIPSIPVAKITGVLPVVNGGTGGASPSASRSSLGAAESGANSDITSLTGLTTALSVTQGGTGAISAGGALTNLGAAASGSNSDITAITGLSTALSVGQGGTGATTPGGALSSLGAAASGANSDITSLSALSTPLSAAQGGSGQSSYTAGDTIYASGATAISKLGIGAANSVMTSSGTAPQWSASLGVASGGTGVTSYTAGDTIYASGATTISKLGIGTAGQVLAVNSGATAPTWTTVNPSTGALLIFEEFLGVHGSAAASVTNTFFPAGSDKVFFGSAATAIARSVAISSTDVNHPGILQLFSNAAGVAAGVAFCQVSSSAGAVGSGSINFTGGPVTMEAVVRVPALGTGATYRIGFGSATVGTTAPTKKTYFEFVGAATGQWVHQSTGTGSASANVGNTFAANAWMKLTITVDSAASTITYQKDSDTAVVVSTAANIPVATDILCPFAANVGTAASSRNLDIDYIKITKVFSTAR